MILLTPGPCMTSEAVRQASAQPDLNHRDPEYLSLAREVKHHLRDLSPGFEPYLIGGSGTAAIEAMVTSCVRSGPALILANGYYSDRLDAIFLVHGIPHTTLRFDWMGGWDLGLVDKTLAAGGYEVVLAVHHETTTGRLNPVEELAALGSRHGVKVLVDAMSSFGADPLTLDGVHAVAASANKCLHGLPGVGFVLVEHGLAESIKGYPRRTYYLSLPMYGGESPPLTAPVPAMLAFRQALREFHAGGGLAGRLASYQVKTELMRSGLRARGYELPVPDDEASCTLTTASLPRGRSFQSWFDEQYARGYVIYACKGELRDRYFQASVMGEVTPAHVEAWLSGLPPAA